jgi:hypothetical protein
MLVISCHADTGFSAHALSRGEDGTLHGVLDNFAGVHAVMRAYFSGRMTRDNLRIELTYGEEVDFAGAYEVLETLYPHDVVIVVDVTGIPTRKDFTVEKCRDAALRAFLERALAGMAFDLYEDCPDPVADEDEVDVYVEKCPHTCFLGGDYNLEKVSCRESSLDAVAEALCRIAESLPARGL